MERLSPWHRILHSSIPGVFHEPSPSNSLQLGSLSRLVVCCTCTWRCMLDRTGPVGAEWRILAEGPEIHTAFHICLFRSLEFQSDFQISEVISCVCLASPPSCKKCKKLRLIEFFFQACMVSWDGVWRGLPGSTMFYVYSQLTRSRKFLPAPSTGPSEGRRVATGPHPQKPALKRTQLGG